MFNTKSLITKIFLLIVCTLTSAAYGAGSIYYIHTDHLGSPKVVTNTSQNVVWKGNYDAFGNVTEEVAQVEMNLRFPGQYLDRESGLHYNWNRYYDPKTGRYISSDPIGLDGGLSTYGYAMQSPVKYTDPTGEAVPLVWLIGAVVTLVSHPLNDPFNPLDLVPAKKVANGASCAIDTGKKVKSASKPDFIVSSKGIAMSTKKDYNLVDSNKKGGDWFQLHNKHTDAKVGGSPHTHYPKQHGGNRTREIKRTDGGDLDRADSALKSGTMRERRNRGDKGG